MIPIRHNLTAIVRFLSTKIGSRWKHWCQYNVKHDQLMRLRWLFQLFYQQVLIKVIKRCCHRHHLLEMLTKVNKRIADEQRGSPNGVATVQVPYLTHTLRAKVLLAVGMNQLMKKIWKECIWKEKNFEEGCGIVRLDSSNTRLTLVDTTQVIRHISEMGIRIAFQMNYTLKFTLTLDGSS